MAEEKKSLNVPPLRFPGFTDEWRKHRFSDIAMFFSGGTPSSQNKSYYGGEIPFIRSGEINSDSTELFLSQDGYDNSSAKMVDVGDLLLALYGATSGEISISKINGAINQAILCVRTPENKFFIKGWWEKHKQIILQSYLQGGQGNLSADIVKKLIITLPCKVEQAKIAHLMALLDERIATQNKIIEKLQSLIGGITDAVISAAVGEEVSFKQIGEAYSGLSGKSAEDFGQGKPYITYLSVYQHLVNKASEYGFVKISETEKQNKVEYGDAIFTLSSETPQETGIGSVYLGNDKELYLNSFCFGVHIMDKARVHSPYLAHLVSSSKFRASVYPLAQGSTRFNLQKNDFMKMKFTLPSVDEQKSIASMLDIMIAKVRNESAILQNYQSQKQFLLSQLFI